MFQSILYILWTLCRAFGLALLAIIGYVVLLAFYRVTLHPLANYPGPKLWAASRIPHSIFNIRGTLPYKVAKLHEKYGSVVRVAPNELSYTTEDAWTDIYAMNTTRPQLKKDTAFGAATRGVKGASNGMLTTPSDEDHGRMRRNFAHSFSEKALRDQEYLITHYFDLLIQKLHEHSHSPVDMTHWYNLLSFDIIGDLVFGESFECLEKSTLHIWVQNIFHRIKVRGYVVIASRLSPLDKLLPLVLSSQMKAKADIHNQFMESKLQHRLSMKDSRPDFMTQVVQNMNTPQGLSYPELQATASILVIAGSETTATLLTGLTFHLLRNPSTLSTLVREIRSTFSSESEITMTSVNTLKFELACIQEALRIFPPVPLSVCRITPPQGITICGRFVPGQTRVGVPQWSTNHSPQNFYHPDSFIPERWLDSSISDNSSPFSNDKRKSVQPFSVGPRNCIGRNLAMAEIRVIVARVLWNFDLELCEESERWIDVDGLMPRVHGLWEKESLMVRLKPVVR